MKVTQLTKNFQEAGVDHCHFPSVYYDSPYPMCHQTLQLVQISANQLPLCWPSQEVLMVKNSPANAGRHQRCEFETWVRKIPWRRAWQPTLVFLPGEPHGQRSLAGCSPWGHKETQLRKLSMQAGRKEHRTKTFSKKSSNLLLKLYLFASEVILITLISLLTNQISYQMISKAILILNLTLCHHRAWATPRASSHHSSPC